MEHTLLSSKICGHNELDAPDAVPEAHEVFLADVEFSPNAKYTIGLAVKEVAAHCAMMPKELTSRMHGKMFWVESTRNLVIIFPVPELEAEMMIEIPKEHWRFRDADRNASQ